MISRSYIKLCEDQSSLEFIEKFGDKTQGISVLDCMAVEVLVVLVGA